MPVEAGGEGLGSGIIHRPACSHHRLHPHSDELGGDVSGELVEVCPALRRVTRCCASQVAAVDKDQFRNPAHLLDVPRGEEHPVTDDHAGDLPGFPDIRLAALFARAWQVNRQEFLLMHAVARQVKDPIAVVVEPCQDRPGIRADLAGDNEAVLFQEVCHCHCLLARTLQAGEHPGSFSRNNRVAHHVYGVLQGGDRALAEVPGLELSQHATGNRPRLEAAQARRGNGR